MAPALHPRSPMPPPELSVPEDRPPLRLAPDGSGPLLQRDYWGVIAGSRLSPEEIGDLLARRLTDFPPPDLATLRRPDPPDRPLEPGDVVEVEIRLTGTFYVQVLHRDERSLTVGTVAGHPEAGRITFGAYRNPKGDVVFHIRSRARSSDRPRRFGFLTAGEPMQTNTWTDFINRLATAVGDGVIGFIRAGTREVEDEPDEAAAAPTFRTREEPADG